MTKKAIILCGLPGSGKTTFYDERFKPFEYEHICINRRSRRFGNARRSVMRAIINGRSFVVDDTNATREERKIYLDMLEGRDYSVECWFFPCPVKSCVEDNELRSSPQPSRLDFPSWDEGYDDIKYVRTICPVFEISSSPFVLTRTTPIRLRPNRLEPEPTVWDTIFKNDKQ